MLQGMLRELGGGETLYGYVGEDEGYGSGERGVEDEGGDRDGEVDEDERAKSGEMLGGEREGDSGEEISTDSAQDGDFQGWAMGMNEGVDEGEEITEIGDREWRLWCENEEEEHAAERRIERHEEKMEAHEEQGWHSENAEDEDEFTHQRGLLSAGESQWVGDKVDEDSTPPSKHEEDITIKDNEVKADPSAESAHIEPASQRPRQLDTQILHHICGCRLVFYNKSNDVSGPQEPKHFRTNTLCDLCLLRAKLDSIGAADMGEFEKMVEALGVENGFEEELESGNLEGAIRAGHGGVDVPREEVGGEDEFEMVGMVGGVVPSMSAVGGATCLNDAKGKTSINDGGD
ncbi:hypothetical protein FKW77_002320 [Venturia effusa]|uniref:Uncharacterized protein n=1 Tax=Venturia effusa TaxID=50376 RepID=A0A517LPW7_9PEZI|nr:hypothetical protein FKW77_002320 [Venturia effusa]